MKKVISILLVLVMALSLCACGTGTNNESNTKPTEQEERYARVTLPDGTVETLDVDEIPSLISENVVAYNSKYPGSKVEVVDTVRKIGSGYGTYGFISVNFSGGWHVSLKPENPILVNLRNGTLVKITGTLDRQTYTIMDAKLTIVEE